MYKLLSKKKIIAMSEHNYSKFLLWIHVDDSMLYFIDYVYLKIDSAH